MSEKMVLIVEDEPAQRKALEVALKLRGFKAEGAGTVVTARELLNRVGDQSDVVILDMRLDDPREPQTTGADLGIEFLNERRKRERWKDVRSATLPEFLILSAYAEADYYRKAMDLDVAAYLQKQQKNQDDVIRHVRALSLRRSLNIGQLKIMEKITQIAERSRTPFEAVTKLCRSIMAPEFEVTLGAPFVLLLGSRNRTEKCGGAPELPEGEHPVYTQIQALTHGQSNRSEPFVLDMQLLSEPPDKESYWLYERMHGGAFLPFWLGKDLRLTVGILRDRTEDPLAEDPEALCHILDQYIRPSILEHTVDILTKLTQLKVQRETVLTMTSKSCISTGQEQLALLEDGIANREVNPSSEFFKKMKGLAEDLRATGETLLPLGAAETDVSRAGGEASEVRPVKVADIVRDAWTAVQEQIKTDGVEPLAVTTQNEFKDLTVIASRVELLLAMTRVMQWMVQRKYRLSESEKQRIFVGWDERDDNVSIAFEDRSTRLGERWRQFLFEPFTQAASQDNWRFEVDKTDGDSDDSRPHDQKHLQAGRYLPLYLAKVLVELKNGGKLEDDTENMGGQVGHRFIMRFPKREEVSPSRSSNAGAAA
jgi:DNA-binding NarL/FixJ family response regulator